MHRHGRILYIGGFLLNQSYFWMCTYLYTNTLYIFPALGMCAWIPTPMYVISALCSEIWICVKWNHLMITTNTFCYDIQIYSKQILLIILCKQHTGQLCVYTIPVLKTWLSTLSAKLGLIRCMARFCPTHLSHVANSWPCNTIPFIYILYNIHISNMPSQLHT